ncbi:uncharacterized protein LOC129616405 [Condylostylus longicornis]|uniref:uncharacterized protein LOC129616405 n=1 Tax=Condylostylus longicornis TaxID=2530218 RepID=UPI00244DA863|nr:uncharacterized protein LOC129616405 [Condylostylus longicornis]
MSNVNSKIHNIYYDKNKENLYGSINKLHKALKNEKISQKKIEAWLRSQPAYTLHYPVKTKFPRNHYLVQKIDQLWEIDLCDLKMFKKYNDGYTFLLTVIDVFSKFPTIASTNKAAVIERFNRTLKEKMFKFFTESSSKRYIDILPQLVKSYNVSVHSTTKFRPAEVQPKHTTEIYNNFKKRFKKDPKLFVDIFVGDLVRVRRKKATFEHGYTEKWTKEIFIVDKVINREPYPLFVLHDLKGKEINGRFYYQELQKVYV